MASRDFSFTLISANDLPDIRRFGRMKVYAEVSLRSSKTKWVTTVDKANDTNPKWNMIVKILIPQSSIEGGPGHIVDIIDVILYCQRSLGKKYIGKVNISLNELFQGSLSNELTRPVWVGDHTCTQGEIKFSYSFGDLVPVKDEKDESSVKRFGKRIVEATIVTAIVEGGDTEDAYTDGRDVNRLEYFSMTTFNPRHARDIPDFDIGGSGGGGGGYSSAARGQPREMDTGGMQHWWKKVWCFLRKMAPRH